LNLILLIGIFDQNADVDIAIHEVNLGQNLDATFDLENSSVNSQYGFVIFKGRIDINSNFTGQASKDWILDSLIHEMIHGFISYQRRLVELGTITQQQYDQMFPLYASDTSEHETMGSQYVNTIADILQANNPNLSRYEALSLSRAGLGTTNYWNSNLTSQERQDAIDFTLVGRGSKTDPNSKQIRC